MMMIVYNILLSTVFKFFPIELLIHDPGTFMTKGEGVPL